MVKRKSGRKIRQSQTKRVRKIDATTGYDTCSESLSSFGGLLPLVKFLDMLHFEDHFHQNFKGPERTPKLGHYRMLLGIILLLFIGFHRIGHFLYIQNDSMMCGILKVTQLPVVSTFWRYLRSLNIHHCDQLLWLQAALRHESWALRGYSPSHVTIDIDTTVATVYGEIQGAHKGHNTKRRGKAGLRPVLCFMAQTGEYICGSQRKGKTITGEEVVKQIRKFRVLLPDSVKKILVRADGEFMGWECIEELEKQQLQYAIGNRRCAAPFASDKWYRYRDYEYNEVMYQPQGWERPIRFVAMRIPKEEKGDRQLPLLEEEKYVYRVFATNLKKAPHKVIKEYDGRANAENHVKEAQREGILAIPSKRYQSNAVYFQLVMLNYNLWQWMKSYLAFIEKGADPETQQECGTTGAIESQTLRIVRLRMMYVPAKIAYHSGIDQVRYSFNDKRIDRLFPFMERMDRLKRAKEAA